MKDDVSELTRKVQNVPIYIENSLHENDVFEDYKQRPPYQQNDYIS